MLSKKHPELKNAVSCVKRISFTERWRHTMLLWKMQKLDENEMKRECKEAGHAEGLAEGLTKGMEAGRKENALDVAWKMKNLGDSSDKIHLITGIDLDIINKL